MLVGGPGGGSFIGSVLALYFAFAFACYSVLLRWGQKTEMVAAQIWNALFIIPFSAVILLLPTPLRDTSGFDALMIGWGNLAVVVFMGAVQLSLGMILFTRGSRTVPAAQLTPAGACRADAGTAMGLACGRRGAGPRHGHRRFRHLVGRRRSGLAFDSPPRALCP
jgi:drug/metabolite transporter (DMT)-like permease